MVATARPLAIGLLLATCVPAQGELHPDEMRLKPRIDEAIQAGVEALFASQLRDGTWGRYGRYDGGKTALCAYALLKCGVGLDHPAVRRAILYLDGVQPAETYTTACMMLAYSATGTKEHLKRVADLARLLVSWQLIKEGKKEDESGDFGYPRMGDQDKFSRPDLSNTQYAALGLWIAQKHKVKIPATVWRRLIQATLQYRSKPEAIQAPKTGTHTVSGGKLEVQGFGYTRNAKPTGSMTAAGIAILHICKLGLGAGLRQGRREVDDAIAKGVAWLGHHFSVRANPGKGRSFHYYYLYGLERVGSLLGIERIGEHWWYVRGARLLLNQQGGDGFWPQGDKQLQTAFALLFLRRATRGGGAVTGRGASGSRNRHLFAGGDSYDDVQIGGAGQQPLSMWVKGFGDELKKRHQQFGIRVVQVEYVNKDRVHGDRIIDQVAGDPSRAWTNESYLGRYENPRRGEHPIRARITVVAPSAAFGATEPTEVIESPLMRVEIRDVWAKWMDYAGKLSAPANLLRTVSLTITASSGQKGAKNVADGNDTTHWLCARDDEKPEITIELDKPVLAKTILLTQAGARGADRGQFDQVLNVEVWINKAVKPLMIDLDEDQLAVTKFDLPSAKKIRTLRFRIVLRLPGRQAHVAGFSEIGLLK